MNFGKFEIPLFKVDQFSSIVNNIVVNNKLRRINTEIGDYSTITGSQYLLSDYEDDLFEIIDYYENEIFKCELILNDAWVIYGTEGTFHTVHTHTSDQNDVLDNEKCTVLYLQTNKDQYPFSCFYAYLENNNGINPYIYTHCPAKGDLLFFSPTTLHGTYPQRKGLRQTLNMDFTLIN
jgi:hypothetical protein